MRTTRLLKNLNINEMSKEHVNEYFQHLTLNRKKSPESVKREKRRQRGTALAHDVSGAHISD